ncbi:uncharacterized protein BDW47DRAFT_121040 [Aspergillus candidus]|uniref:Uncharacterized protein n=1 Tax=Aspergillus candidus TaxID=41067 RepID=A0A2I2EZ18_ASPCN|nr:hypothetical protein BDW47DRAFT_121040 [Aspergillus candidus]PLB33616.1 hypothetical protein BDW47DRAFT_121040 [Aspergillus candidus]
MHPLTPLLPLTLASTASAWALIWRNASGFPRTEHTNEIQPCKQIDHAKGEQFDWDAQGGDWCIYFYMQDNCTQGKGHECNNRDWVTTASADLKSFKIEEGFSSKATVPTATATETVTVDRDVEVPVSAPPSAGVIAGAIVGAIVGAVAFILLGWFLGRRGGASAAGAEGDAAAGGGAAGGDAAATAAAVAAAAEEEEKKFAPPERPPTRPQHTDSFSNTSQMTPPLHPPVPVAYPPAELLATTGEVEMSDSHRVVEMGQGGRNE